MRTKEFVKRVEELGYLVDDNYYHYWEIRNNKNYLIAVVSKDVLYKISTDSGYWDDISDEDKNKLLELIVEFASTPVEDREEEEKFYLKHRWLMTEFGDTYYLCKCYNAAGKISYGVRLSYITHDETWLFTLKEIEEIKEKFDTDLSDYELVKVKNEN